MKGSANASENASIVTIGSQNCPWVDFISTDPTMGPVQEKDTNTSVRATKNAPIRPPDSLFASDLFTSLLGITISNAPKKDAANSMKMMKNRMLGIQWVARKLNMSAVTASPPVIRLMRISTAIGRV